jgi:hypothetical protein
MRRGFRCTHSCCRGCRDLRVRICPLSVNLGARLVDDNNRKAAILEPGFVRA